MVISYDTHQGRQENQLCRICKALKHVLLLVNKALHLGVWVLYNHYTTIISVKKNRPQIPVLPIVKDVFETYNS